MQNAMKIMERMELRLPSGKEKSIEISQCDVEYLKPERSRNLVAELYIRAFSGAPWYEKYLVRIGGKWARMGSPDELSALERMRSEGTIKEDDIKPFYTREAVKASMSNAFNSGNFIASIAFDDTQERLGWETWAEIKIVGVSWGMSATTIPSAEKLSSVSQVMRNRNLPQERTFYFDETFVDAGYRGIGIGRSLVEIRGASAIMSGFEYAIVRTINQVQVNNLVSVFGKSNVTDVYSNPDDPQPDRKYYLIDLTKMKRD